MLDGKASRSNSVSVGQQPITQYRQRRRHGRPGTGGNDKRPRTDSLPGHIEGLVGNKACLSHQQPVAGNFHGPLRCTLCQLVSHGPCMAPQIVRLQPLLQHPAGAKLAQARPTLACVQSGFGWHAAHACAGRAQWSTIDQHDRRVRALDLVEWRKAGGTGANHRDVDRKRVIHGVSSGQCSVCWAAWVNAGYGQCQAQSRPCQPAGPARARHRRGGVAAQDRRHRGSVGVVIASRRCVSVARDSSPTRVPTSWPRASKNSVVGSAL